jgi:poly-gamma-glutamate capsule biosynthesis protein CapA/YwtB (metallophosphatase superfamily)
MRALVALVVLLAVAAAVAGAATPRLTLRTAMPAWLAPGAGFEVTGSTTAGLPVSVLSDGRRIGAGRADARGRFTVLAHASGAGRHRVVVAVGGLRAFAGRLLVRPLVLAAVGDITPGEDVGPAVRARGMTYPWAHVGALLRRADLATGNLEGAITDRGTPAADKQYLFRGPVALLTGARKQAGLDVVTVANNHSLDYGSVGLLDTLAAARRVGIATVGGGANLVAARRWASFVSGGLRVAFLGYSDVLPAGFPAGPSTPGVAPADVDAIAHDVRAARQTNDVVVAFFHWGVELRAAPDSRQRSFADAALRAGATVVLGAHPHVLGRVSRSGRALVAWSLGNFVFPPHSPLAERTAILRVRLTARGVAGFDLVRARAGVQPTLG